jgi:septum formation protein
MTLILASKSPRRIQILNSVGIFPIVIAPKFDESKLIESLPKETAADIALLVMQLAKGKAEEVLQRIHGGDFAQSLLKNMLEDDYYRVLAADTVVFDGDIIGKPKDKDDAVKILQRLRNKSHLVFTGVCLMDMDGKNDTFFDESRVYFKDYSDDDIINFLISEPPYDKAGAYAIQGTFSKHISHVDGDETTVIGLPWKKIEERL